MNPVQIRNIKLGVVAALLVLAGMVGLSYHTLRAYAATSEAVLRTHDVKDALAATLAGIQAVETGARGYVITADSRFLEAYERGLKTEVRDLSRLRALMADNRAQQLRLDALAPLVAQKLDVARRNVTVRRTEGLAAAVADVASAEGKGIMDRIRTVLAELQAEEDRLLKDRLAATRRHGARTVAMLAGGLLLNGLLVLAIILLIRRDWRARDAAAQALRESAEQVRDLYNRAPCGYHSLDAGGVFTAVNDTELAWLGYARDEIVGRKRLTDLLTAASTAIFAERFPRFKAGEAISDLEMELVRKDGSILPVVVAATPVMDAQGRYGSSRSTLFDNRERKRAEQLGVQARAYAESIVESVREPLLILTEDLRAHGANRAYYDCFQTTPALTEGRRFAALAGGTWNRPELLAALGRVMAGTELTDCEETVEVPGVGRKIFRLSARKLHRPGNHATMMLVALADETARRTAEQELERFFTLSLDFLCISSADGYFKRVSPAVTDILGWTTEEFLARPFLDYVHPEDQPATLREVQAQVKEGRRVLSFENRYRHKAGRWRVLSWKSVPQPDGLMYATARDVTERKEQEREYRRLHAELQRRAQDLETANAELEAFSYSVSHDLRAPLRHIDGYAQLLGKQAGATLDAKSRRYLDIIGEAVRNLGVLIDELLTFSRMGRTEMRRLGVNMGELVADVVRGLEAEAQGRNLAWRVGELPEVRADQAMMRQVWANLLGNAVKYTRHQTQPCIEISHRRDGVDGHVFSVRDNGAGFDMRYAGKLFGVFQRLHSAGEFEGTGIGLANVRRIVTRHGGRTWAEGAVGAGATFHFSLPAAEA